MFQPWRVRIREAQAAYRNGRLDEAQQTLAADELFRYQPGQALSQKVARELVVRAKTRLASGESMSPWKDLDHAAELIGETNEVTEVRTALVERVIANSRKLLEQGQPKQARESLARLERRGPLCAKGRAINQAAQHAERAMLKADEGSFSDAEHEIGKANVVLPDCAPLVDLQQHYADRGAELRLLSALLHDSMRREDWAETLDRAEAILEISPRSPHALAARRRAWAAVGLRTTQTHLGAGYHLGNNGGKQSTRHHASPVKVDTVRNETPRNENPEPRYVLWVDAVGGYLVCLGDHLVIGPPMSDGSVDIPLLADVSRRHAVIHRDGEGYVIEPVRVTSIDGRPLTGPTTLCDGAIIGLGNAELRFRRPHALSATVRLEIISGHRTDPAVDAILLMADTCILGPQLRSHVVCRPWEHDLVLFRQGKRLVCRSSQPYEVDGQERSGATPLESGSRIEGDSFSLTIEKV